jgi:hypothetical protein
VLRGSECKRDYGVSDGRPTSLASPRAHARLVDPLRDVVTARATAAHTAPFVLVVSEQMVAAEALVPLFRLAGPLRPPSPSFWGPRVSSTPLGGEQPP